MSVFDNKKLEMIENTTNFIKKLEKEERFGEMFFIFSLFSIGKNFLPTGQRILFHGEPNSNSTFHQLIHLFF